MTSKILINAQNPEEIRIAKVQGQKLVQFHVETAAREITQGNIYKGVIARIEPSLQAVFVDYGAERHGFLQRPEIHPDYFQDAPNGDRSIRALVKRGQSLLVQVTKDPIMKKGAMLTTYLSLAGRYLVLMPGTENRGISRKIEDESERQRLKDIISQLNIPEDFGAIIRTVGAKANKTVLSKDFRYLMRLWRNIKSDVMNKPTPYLMYKERNLVERSIRDYYTTDVKEVLIDDPTAHKTAKDFMSIISPKNSKTVKLHKEDKPIFTKFQLEDQIASIFENRVNLKSGGTIVIEQTEALVSIDVNSGRATQGANIEQTALKTNLEAAEEICRQLQLRDLGGLIVGDFIDMRDAKNRREVERALKSHLKGDKAKTKVGNISRFGLMEMSRQRLRPSIEFGSYQTCHYCNGKGLVPSIETLSLQFLRKLNMEMLHGEKSTVIGTVPAAIADYLLNKKRRDIMDLESRRGITVVIKADPSLTPGQSHIKRAETV